MTEVRTTILGKNAKTVGQAPAVILENPKYAHNVGAVIRAASCYDISQVWYTGVRVALDLERRTRIPREERMKGYGKVSLMNSDYPFDAFDKSVVPIAVEINPSAEPLATFVHPEKAVYVFGPEDGSIPSSMYRHCHRFIIIPTAHCLNLSVAVATVLYDRKAKRQQQGLDPILPASATLDEQRGYDIRGLYDQHGEMSEDR